MAEKYGKWAFIIGLLLVLLFAFMPTLLGTSGLLLLVILGLVIGYLNVKASESQLAILVVIGLPLVAQTLAAIPVIDQLVGPILDNLTALIGGAAVPVVLTAVYRIFSKH